jgi:nuclear pore complex protein Nup62
MNFCFFIFNFRMNPLNFSTNTNPLSFGIGLGTDQSKNTSLTASSSAITNQSLGFSTSGLNVASANPSGFGTGSGISIGSTPSLGNTLQLNTSTVGPKVTTQTTTQSNSNQDQTQNVSSGSTVTFKIFEDYVNKWMSELDSQEKDFLSQATQLNALDKVMIDNGEKVIIKF